MSRTHPTRHTPHVALWFASSLVYFAHDFALFARHRMILSPEEEFALENAEAEGHRAEAPG